MEFGSPQKLPDGRYFLKITGQMLQLNNVKVQEGLSSPALTIEVSDEKFLSVDEAILAKAKESKVSWFGRELSDETIQGAYQTSITDGYLNANLAKIKGEIVTKAFNSQKEPIELSEIGPETQCDIFVELSGLWFLKKSFGPVWRVVQARVRGGPRPPSFPTQYMFEDAEEEVQDDPSDYVD
jgi:Family of unknown function (DUF5871)